MGVMNTKIYRAALVLFLGTFVLFLGRADAVTVSTSMNLTSVPFTPTDSNLTITGTGYVSGNINNNGASRNIWLLDIQAGGTFSLSAGRHVRVGGIRNAGTLSLGNSDTLDIMNDNIIAADSDFVCWGAGSINVTGNASRAANIRGVAIGGVRPAFFYRSTSGTFQLSGCTVSGFYHSFPGYPSGLTILMTAPRTVSNRDVYFTNVTFDSCAVHVGNTNASTRLRGFRMDNCIFNLNNTDGFIRIASPLDTLYRVQVRYTQTGGIAYGYGFLLEAGADSAYVYGCSITATGVSGESRLDRGIQVNAAYVKMDRDTIRDTRFNVVTTSSNSHGAQLLNSVLSGASHEQLHWEGAAADSNWTVTGNLIYGGAARSIVTIYNAGTGNPTTSIMKNLKFHYNTVVSTFGGKGAFGFDCDAGTGCGYTCPSISMIGNIFMGNSGSPYNSGDIMCSGYSSIVFTEFKHNVFDKIDTTLLGTTHITYPYSVTDSNKISSAFGFVDSTSPARDYRLSGSSPILNCGDVTMYTQLFGGANAPGDPGYYQSSTTGTCGGAPPTPTGACCYNYTCAVVTQAQCTDLGGVYEGDGTTVCDECTAPPLSGRLFSHAKFAQMTYSGSTQTAATGTFLGQHADLTIGPTATLYNAALAANPGHKWIAYMTLSTLRLNDTNDLRTYAQARGWNHDTLIMRASGTVSMEPPQPAGAPCVAGQCTTTTINGRIVMCQWTSYRNYPDWNKPGAWYFTINKAIGAGNYGLMEDEAQTNFYQGNLGAVYTDSVQSPAIAGVTWPDEEAWCSGSPSDAIGWGAYNTATLRRLRMLELHRTYIPQLVDSLNAHGKKIFSNGAAYVWGRAELIQDMQRWGRSILYGEGMVMSPTYNGYKETSWEFMDSVASWGPSKGGEAAIWCYINRQDSLAMPAGQRIKRILHHNFCWYMMAASDYTYFTPIGNDGAANPPLIANDFKIADTAQKWINAFAVDIGTATGSRAIVQAGTYPVYRRNFQYGSILYRPGANGADMSDASAISIPLGRTMYRVNYDSSKQAGATSVSIRVGDGAILVDSTYFSAPVNTGQITVGDASVTEGGNMVFTVTLSQAQSTITSFGYSTSDGSAIAATDYTATIGGKSIPIGQTSTTISIPTINRANCQTSRAFTVTINNVLPSTITIIDPTGTGTINDDDCGPTSYGKRYKGKIAIKGKVKP